MNKPIKTLKSDNMTLKLWENKNNEIVTKTITFEKSYKDKNDNWKNTQNVKISDLPILKTLLEEMYKDLTIKS